jgi:hypothetical protein
MGLFLLVEIIFVLFNSYASNGNINPKQSEGIQFYSPNKNPQKNPNKNIISVFYTK